MGRALLRVCASACLLLHVGAVGAVERVTLHALFKDKAIVLVDGTRRVVASGASTPEGVKLLGTDTAAETAEVEFNGRRELLRLGTVAAAFNSASRGSVTLYAEPSGHYHADGLINGVAVRFLVDTGATTIAMNSAAAQRVGIDYRRVGRPSLASTAGGIVQTYNVKLDTVQVGDITLHGVEGAIIEGRFPREVLLGMSFLGRLDLRRDGERLQMEQRF
jgi:aspartyl protease family protein